MRVPYTRIMQAMVTQNVRRPQGHENYVSGTPGAMVIVYLLFLLKGHDPGQSIIVPCY